MGCIPLCSPIGPLALSFLVSRIARHGSFSYRSKRQSRWFQVRTSRLTGLTISIYIYAPEIPRTLSLVSSPKTNSIHAQYQKRMPTAPCTITTLPNSHSFQVPNQKNKQITTPQQNSNEKGGQKSHLPRYRAPKPTIRNANCRLTKCNPITTNPYPA
ncbi:hypothetical protein BDV26DRAFT_254069 [Aspergillus bertholletiae]|uniref:Uncharacterized protein n=1 Tax=Aspergillus bertholletiae TaxID=1226010 RepID=A0A5N7BK78_9EURO|nr:hypothetical protein BDV26DRAFT_254069 [Aspergillus bertholletiae]